MPGFGHAIDELSRMSREINAQRGQKQDFGESIPNGACWKEKDTMFFTRSMGMDMESRGNPSLRTILMRPRSSAGLQKLWCRSSWRNGGNLRGSRSPFLVKSTSSISSDSGL
jgi:hypothetical protein